jgi:hypothetical protein
LRVLPDEVAAGWPEGQTLPEIADQPALALDETLRAIAARYGTRTAEFVATQLEYPWPGGAR